MDGYLSKSRGFIGSSQEYESAHFVLFGIPMDFTASFHPGSRWGPRAIREASDSLKNTVSTAGDPWRKSSTMMVAI